MFQKIVEKLLNKILGEYVEDFNSENLKIGLWSGQVVLKDVKIKKEAMKKFNLPFKLRYSKLRCLKMNIPWSSIASSKIEVLIQGLQILISQIHPSQWQLKNEKIITLRKEQIRAFSQSIINDFAQKAQKMNAKPEEEEGYFSGLVVKIIDNLQVTIKDIHIRYEDQIYNEYSFGATLQELKIFTVNENDEPVFIDRTKKQFKNQPLRKRLVLSDFGIYWNEKSTFFEEQTMGESLRKTIARKTDPNINGMNYIILMSFQARLLQRQKGQQFKDPEIDFFLDFDQLKIQISNKQLQQIVNMGERLQTFSTEVKRKNKVKLSKEQTQQNLKFFQEIYPKFYKNQTISQPEMEKLDDLLEKMEVQTFKPIMKKYLQDKEKERIMKEKKDKSRGWFSGPKELTQEEKQEIENFLQNNFGQQVKTVTRPKDFFYIRVNLRIKILEVVISNAQNGLTQGIRTRLLYIGTQFKLRETGYWLEFGIKDIYIDLFKQVKGSQQESQEFLRKLVDNQEKGRSAEYVRLIVQGSPIDRPYADTYIKLMTEQLLIMFDPKIINVAKNFANIKVNAENSSAALQKYGQIKEKTANSVNQTLESKKKSFIYIDIKLKSITAILYFDPSKPEEDIWAITLGETKIYTDKETLKKTEAKPDEPTQKYSMELNKISFRYYQNSQIFLDKRLNGNLDDEKRLEDVLTNLNIDVTLSIFKQNTLEIPKFNALAEMSEFTTNLTAFTYSNLQKMGNCFVDKDAQSINIQKRSQEKTDVLKNAKKIGNIYLEDSLIKKKWNKYIGILSNNYLYLYNDKKDINYVYYYYVKNSFIKVVENSDPKGKEFCFHLKNKVDSVVLGFDKKQTMDDWIDTIKKCRDYDEDSLPELTMSTKNSKNSSSEDKDKEVIAKTQVDPNILNYVVGIKIKAITINTYINQQAESPQIIQIKLTKINLKLNLHEKKHIIKLSLLSIDLKDNILKYKMTSLQKLLQTDIGSEKEKLIDIKVTLTDEKHPQYQYTDVEVDVSFGKLVINYKAETVIETMKFFIPPSNNKKKPEEVPKIDQQSPEDSMNSKLAIRSAIFAQKMERFSLKVHLKMAQIAVKLINTKTRVFFAEISMQNFEMMFGISDIRMVVTGGLQQLSLKDYSNYPETVLQQQDKYENFKYLMTSEKRKKRLDENQNQIPHLIFFDVNMLNKPNEAGKKMLIEAEINDLQVSYIQQPVLRLITYLNTQLLPSFSPQAADSNNIRTSVKKEKSKEQKQKEMQEKDKKNSVEPQLNTMQLKVTVTNINVVLQPRNPLNQQMKLNIKYLTVKNNSLYREYLHNTQDKVLVENYDIRLTDMSMFVSYPHPKTNQRRSYKLTPDIDFRLNVDMIQNPIYYEKTYGSNFLDGMRIEVWMSNFFMRINHEDYNFMMKCLYWNITYDDNAEIYLFDAPEQSLQEKKRQIPPLYFNLRIESVSLFIIEDKLPLAFLLLNSLDYKFIKAGANSMFMRLDVQDMIGSSLVHKQNNRSFERGMFNNFGYEKEFKTDELRDLDKLLTFFQRKDQIQDKKNKKKVIIFEMDTDSENNSFMCVKVQQLNIVVQMKTLLVLSQLALMEPYIQPPKSKLEPLISEEEKEKKKEQQKQLKEQNKPKTGKSQMYLQLRDFLASLTDFQNENFFTMDGQILGKMITYPTQADEQVVKISKSAKQPKFLQHSSYGFELRNFSIFYSHILNMKKKRFILKPFSIVVSMNKDYEIVQAQKQSQPVKDLIREQPKNNKLKEEQDESKAFLKKPKQDKQSKEKESKQAKQQKPIVPKPTEDVIVLLNQIQATIDNLIFQASIRDMIKINEIIQENLSNMKAKQPEEKIVEDKVKQKKEEVKQKINQKLDQKEKQKADSQQQIVERTKTTLQKPILQKMKAKVDMNPIELLIINDCDQNFMPVLKFIIQKTTPTFESDIVQGRLNLILTFNLSFFNPRSSKWQPVIETYSAVFDYLNLIGEKHNVTKMFLTNSDVTELKELKINISTQFIASLMTTLEKSKEEQNMIKSSKQISLREQVQVSPFILQNITNKSITIRRKILGQQNDFVLKPMFKGTVRLTQDAQNLQFLIGQNTKVFKVSLQHYGVINIHSTFYYIEFKVDKLNRIIRFLSDTVIQNELTHTLYVKRYFRNGKADEEDFVIERKQMLALDGVKDMQISFNQKSYSEKANINNIKALHESAAVRALNGKFLLWITKKSLPNQFTTLQIWPPLNIYNCLPKQFTIQFIVDGKVHTKQIRAQTSHEVNANIDFYQLKNTINLPGFYWSPHFQMREDNIGKEMELKLKDIDKEDRSSTINYIFQKTERGYTLILYCKTFLISQLQDDILAYGNLADDEAHQRTQQYYVLGGQRAKSAQHDDDIVIIGNEFGSKLRICGDGCMIDFSQPFSLGGIGLTQNRRIVIKRQYNGKKIDLFTTIGVDVAIKKMFKNQNIFSKMITIHSRAIIINNTTKNFKLRQEGSSKEIFTIASNERKNLYFTLPANPSHPRGMIFRTDDSTPSIPVNVHELGTIYFKVNNKQTQEDEFYKIFIQEVSKYIFYEITQLTEETIPYQIENKMPRSRVLVKFNNVTLCQGEKFSFINESFKEEHLITVRISHENARESRDITIRPDDLNFLHRQALEISIGGMKGTVHCQARVQFDDKKKYIIIDEVSRRLGYDIDQEQEEYEISSMNIKLEKISFSFIQNHISINRPFESFCFFLQGIQLFNEQTNLESKFQVKLNYLQFDQEKPFNMPNPVIITPYKMKQFLREQNPKSIFNLYINKNKRFSHNTFINKFQVEFNDLVVKVSQYFIDLVMTMSKEFIQVSNYKEEDYRVQRQVDKWNDVNVPKEGAKTFIKHIAIAPFVLEVSAEIKFDQLDTQALLFFGTILNALGVAITNIEGAPISLDGIVLQDCVDTLAGINQKLMNHYKNTVIKQFYKIFGSLNIIGNPIGLFRNISTGFKDLKDKPSEGFVQGPLQFGKGMVEGTSSLIAHSIGGALNSVSKVTGTISTGLAVLAFDKEFQALREKQKMQKPQHIFQGIQKGGKAIFYGFRQGIKGVFMQPYENTKTEGVVGFFKGTAKGLAGLVIKPVTGVIDFASKTTEGLKNTALYLQDKPNQNRMRYPRVFYTECFIVKEYDEVDSKLNAIINKLKYESKYQSSHFIQSYRCDDGRFLLILQDRVIMVRIEEEKVSWAINMNDLMILENDNERKELKVKDVVERTFSKSDHNIKIEDDSVRTKIVNQIKIMQSEYNQEVKEQPNDFW